LAFQVLDDGLVVDEVAFVLGEVLRTDVLNLLELFVVLLVDSVVVRVHLLGGHLHEVLQVIDLRLLLVQGLFFQGADLLLQS